jgi:hypothetical protein
MAFGISLLTTEAASLDPAETTLCVGEIVNLTVRLMARKWYEKASAVWDETARAAATAYLDASH